MKNYVPFLKLKVNEVGALKALTPDIAEGLVPFFDLPKQKDGANSEAFMALVVKAARSVENNLKSFYTFFLDNFDVDDSITIAGENNYAFVIDQFLDLNFIPVIGLDRPPDRNKLVFDRKRAGKIASDSIAFRLQPEDFANFLLVKDDIGALIDEGSQFFKYWILVLDNRVCTKVKVADRTAQIAQFVAESHKTFKFFSVIVTGSSIPASIKDIIEVESDTTHDRKELAVYSGAIKKLKGIPMVLGDYTVVSPLYSEFQIPPAVMLNVMAPKVIYSYDDVHFVARGGALRTHARGNLQYNDIARDLCSQPFYRGPAYSFGDKFLDDKANGLGNKVMPSTILKPTINAHITYMVRDFVA